MTAKIYLLGLSALMLSGCGGGSATSSAVSMPASGAYMMKASSPYRAPAISQSLKNAYLNAVNDARRKPQDCGSRGHFSAASELKWSDALYRAAYEHSHDLAQTNTFDHRGSGRATDHTGKVLHLNRGSTFKERIATNGYRQIRTISENITAGTMRDTAQKAVNAWIKSDGHCANLMNPDIKDMGMAHVSKADTVYTHYWTQNFGKSK